MKIPNHICLLPVCFLLAAACVKRIEPGLSKPELEQQIPPPPTGEPKDYPIFFTWDESPMVIVLLHPKSSPPPSILRSWLVGFH